MRVSIRQVAQRAGVSAMTVSNVLRDREGQMVGETRRRVLEAIHELGYVPVRSSMQNRHVRTNCLGLVFIQSMQGAVGYPTFLGMCERARQVDYDLTMLLRSEPDWVKPGRPHNFWIGAVTGLSSSVMVAARSRRHWCATPFRWSSAAASRHPPA